MNKELLERPKNLWDKWCHKGTQNFGTAAVAVGRRSKKGAIIPDP